MYMPKAKNSQVKKHRKVNFHLYIYFQLCLNQNTTIIKEELHKIYEHALKEKRS